MRDLVGLAIEATKVDASARRLFAGVTAALAAAVVLGGCGASSSSPVSTRSLPASSTPGATSPTSAGRTAVTRRCDPAPCELTRAELAAKVDELCLRGNAAVEQADASFAQATKTRDYTKAAAAMETALREFPPYQFAILGLTPSVGTRATFTRFVDLTVRVHGLSERIYAAGRAGDTQAVVRLSQLVQEDLATRTRAAVDLGTKHCGR